MIFKDPESGTEARVDFRTSFTDNGMDVCVTDMTTEKWLGKVFVPASKPKTHEVGVIYNGVASRPTVQVYTYDAKVDLDLKIGDQVQCPIGFRDGKEAGNKVGTVVTLNPAKSPAMKRTITEKLDRLKFSDIS